MKELSFKDAMKISQDTLEKAEKERAEVAEKEAAESRAYKPKEIWIVHAFNEAMLKDFQSGGAKGKWNSTKPGFFFDEQDAIDAVLDNELDLCEGQMNKYAIVYPIAEGIDMCCMEQERIKWFEYVPETDKYKPIERQSTGCVVFGFD